MPNAFQDSTNFDKVLKDHYGPQICKVMNNKVKLRKLLAKNKRPTDGRQVVFPAHVGRGHSFRYQTAGDDLAAAGFQETVSVIVPYKDAFSHVRITEKVIKQSKSDRGAFERALAFELEGATADMAIQENRSAYGVGDGKLGEVSSSTATVCTTMGLSSAAGSGINGNASNRYLRIGDVIDFYTAAGVARLQGAKITALDITNDQFTFSGGIGATPAVTDGIYLQQPSLGSPTAVDAMGLGGIIDNNTYLQTLHNVDRAVYPQWKAHVINVGSSITATGALTLQVMQRLEDMMTDAGYGDDYAIVCHASVRNQFAQISFPDRRYQTRKYDTGFKEDKGETGTGSDLSFNDHPVIQERDCPWSTMFFANRASIQQFEVADVHWVEDDKGAVLRLVPGKAGLYEAQLAHYYNIGVEAMGPNSNGALRFISSTVDRVYIA